MRRGTSSTPGPAETGEPAPVATIVSRFLYGANTRTPNRSLPPGERPRPPVIITPVISYFPRRREKGPHAGLAQTQRGPGRPRGHRTVRVLPPPPRARRRPAPRLPGRVRVGRRLPAAHRRGRAADLRGRPPAGRAQPARPGPD